MADFAAIESSIKTIIDKIAQIQQSQSSMFSSFVGNINNKLVLVIPLLFILIIGYIKNTYGNKKIIKVLLAIILIIFILYLSFMFVSTGTVMTGLQTAFAQGLALAGAGGMVLDSDVLNINTFIEDILTYLNSPV